MCTCKKIRAVLVPWHHIDDAVRPWRQSALPDESNRRERSRPSQNVPFQSCGIPRRPPRDNRYAWTVQSAALETKGGANVLPKLSLLFLVAAATTTALSVARSDDGGPVEDLSPPVAESASSGQSACKTLVPQW